MPDQARVLAAKTLELLEQHKIAPTPQNYELWFLYAIGQNAQLVQAINALIALPEGVTPAALTKLYETHCSKSGSGETVADVGGKLQDEIKKLASLLEGAGADTAAYGKSLNTLAVQLDTDSGAPQLKLLIGSVAAATKAMESRNRNLEAQLSQSGEEVKTLRRRIEAIRIESMVDALTNIANRRCFDEKLDEAVAEALAEGQDLCLLIGDVDHFKKFNDNWGHATGDQVLRLVAQCFKANTKGKDTAARYGGEEFVVILPNTSLANAGIVANQIRTSVESKKIVKRSTGETLGAITVSIGAALYRPGESVTEMINRADACLYGAKNTGRNRVVHEGELEQIRNFGGGMSAA
jgi:diguanylate cyclase